jgi:hypothetical protein
MKLDLYAIPVRNGRVALFSPPEALTALEAESSDRVRQFIDWFVRRPNRIMAWIGRGIRSVHDYYLRLEDKIDPVERVVKAMASTNHFIVHAQDPAEFQRALRRQRRKHVFWFSIDFVITGVVIIFTPFLAPIPGPNFFLYYPFLRLLSHYRAILGATSGLRSSDVEFKDLPERSRLEDNLPGLARFLERMD